MFTPNGLDHCALREIDSALKKLLFSFTFVELDRYHYPHPPDNEEKRGESDMCVGMRAPSVNDG